jgi:hypothetical protein
VVLVLSLTACVTAAAGAIGSSDPAVVCVRGYSRMVRPPNDYGWRRFRVSVFRAYGIPHEQWRKFTLDHLVSLAIRRCARRPA